MVIASTSSLGHFHGSNADPFGLNIESSDNSSLYPSFGTWNPFGSRIGPPLFAEKISSPSGSTSSYFGGIQSTTKFGGIASTNGIDNQCRGSALASYRTTPEVDGINSSYPIGKVSSISAMPIYKNKSHEELRSEDYELHKGSIFSIQNQGNAFRQSNSHFGPTVAGTSFKPPFGSTGTVFGVSPSFKPGNSIGDSNVNRSSRNSVFEESSITIFGAPKNSGIGFKSTPPNFHSNSGYGSTSSIFGVKVPPFSPGSSSIFGSSSISGIQGFSGSQGPITPERTIGNYHQGSRVVTYSATPEVNGANKRYSVEKIQSISAMPTNKDKSHQELRSEDYELRNKGGHTPWDGQSLASASFKTFDSPENIFRNPPLSNQSSFSSPFCPFKSNLSDPKSQDLVTPSSTISPSPNPFSLDKSNPFQSQAFIPQPTVVSPMPTFNANLHPSFVAPFSESGQTNSCQYPAISTTSTGPSLSAFSLSKLSSTVSPSTESTSLAALGPWPSEWPSIPNASQPGETAEKLDCHFTNNLSQPSLDGLTMVTEVGGQNINGQQYVPASTVGMQSSPFPTLSAIDRPNTVTSIQHGISSLPASNNLSSNRRTSLLRIRHVSLRHNWLPAQRHSSGSSEPKVPFFSDQEDGPCPISPFLPRENPRAWVMNSLSRHSYSDGKGCEEKELPSSSFQLNVNSKGVTGGDTFIQEEDLPAILNRHQDNDATVIEKHEADVLALMPKLPDSEYYTEPSLNELAAKEMAEPGSCSRVNDFVIGRLGFGCIKFLGETDVHYLDLESVVQFNDREVIVYADDRKKPPVGQSLNKPAEVTLLNVKCISKKTGKQYVDGPQVRSFKERLMKKASEQGAEFVSYDPVQGEWKFRVEHF